MTRWFRKRKKVARPGKAIPVVRAGKVALVGNPNVGKSVLFNALTGAYVTVSNYPGTSVEVTRGTALIDDRQYEIIDTPGMYALLPITEEERVAREILLTESPDLVLHVLDARNLERMLPMTLQLVEAGVPVVLVVDIMDEAQTDAITVNHCMGTIMGISKTTACLPLSLMNDDGYLAFCESDFVVIPSGILLH